MHLKAESTGCKTNGKGHGGLLPSAKRSAGPFYLNVRISTCYQKKHHPSGGVFFGGLEEIRTPDPRNANAMRSQLRYEPLLFGGA